MYLRLFTELQAIQNIKNESKPKNKNNIVDEESND